MSRPPAGSLRLLALPLARRKAAGETPLIYFHAYAPPQSLSAPTTDGEKPPLLTRATNFAAAQWEKLGKAKGGWRIKVYTFGEKMMDRISYEEWALKGLDTSLGPKPWQRAPVDPPDPLADTPDNGSKESLPLGKPTPPPRAGAVSVIFPPSLISESALNDELLQLASQREPYHRKYMYYCGFGAPMTLPLAIIPVMPNLPGFYLLWRTWSHWRAYKASSYLKSLVGARQLLYEPSKALDKIYSTTVPGKDRLLLNDESITALVDKFGLADQARIDVRRAVTQLTATMKEEADKEASEKGSKEEQDKPTS